MEVVKAKVFECRMRRYCTIIWNGKMGV